MRLKQIPGVVSAESFGLTEHCELAVAQLKQSRIEEADPEASFAVLEHGVRATIAGKTLRTVIQMKPVTIEAADSIPVERNPECAVPVNEQRLDVLRRQYQWGDDNTTITNLCHASPKSPDPQGAIARSSKAGDGIVRQSFASGEGEDSAIVEMEKTVLGCDPECSVGVPEKARYHRGRERARSRTELDASSGNAIQTLGRAHPNGAVSIFAKRSDVIG